MPLTEQEELELLELEAAANTAVLGPPGAPAEGGVVGTGRVDPVQVTPPTAPPGGRPVKAQDVLRQSGQVILPAAMDVIEKVGPFAKTAAVETAKSPAEITFGAGGGLLGFILGGPPGAVLGAVGGSAAGKEADQRFFQKEERSLAGNVFASAAEETISRIATGTLNFIAKRTPLIGPGIRGVIDTLVGKKRPKPEDVVLTAKAIDPTKAGTEAGERSIIEAQKAITGERPLTFFEETGGEALAGKAEVLRRKATAAKKVASFDSQLVAKRQQIEGAIDKALKGPITPGMNDVGYKTLSKNIVDLRKNSAQSLNTLDARIAPITEKVNVNFDRSGNFSTSILDEMAAIKTEMNNAIGSDATDKIYNDILEVITKPVKKVRLVPDSQGVLTRKEVIEPVLRDDVTLAEMISLDRNVRNRLPNFSQSAEVQDRVVAAYDKRVFESLIEPRMTSSRAVAFEDQVISDKELAALLLRDEEAAKIAAFTGSKLAKRVGTTEARQALKGAEAKELRKITGERPLTFFEETGGEALAGKAEVLRRKATAAKKVASFDSQLVAKRQQIEGAIDKALKGPITPGMNDVGYKTLSKNIVDLRKNSAQSLNTLDARIAPITEKVNVNFDRSGNFSTSILDEMAAIKTEMNNAIGSDATDKIYNDILEVITKPVKKVRLVPDSQGVLTRKEVIEPVLRDDVTLAEMISLDRNVRNRLPNFSQSAEVQDRVVAAYDKRVFESLIEPRMTSSRAVAFEDQVISDKELAALLLRDEEAAKIAAFTGSKLAKRVGTTEARQALKGAEAKELRKIIFDDPQIMRETLDLMELVSPDALPKFKAFLRNDVVSELTDPKLGEITFNKIKGFRNKVSDETLETAFGPEFVQNLNDVQLIKLGMGNLGVTAKGTVVDPLEELGETIGKIVATPLQGRVKMFSALTTELKEFFGLGSVSDRQIYQALRGEVGEQLFDNLQKAPLADPATATLVNQLFRELGKIGVKTRDSMSRNEYMDAANAAMLEFEQEFNKNFPNAREELQ